MAGRVGDAAEGGPQRSSSREHACRAHGGGPWHRAGPADAPAPQSRRESQAAVPRLGSHLKRAIQLATEGFPFVACCQRFMDPVAVVKTQS